MKAAVWTKYGPPEVLKIKEVKKPILKDDEVLIKVHAASINSWDWELFTARPFTFFGGQRRPRHKILGCDISGVVEDVGKNAKHFKVDDEVFGDISKCNWGGFAEYVCACEKKLALKSNHMTFEQAAAMPQAGVLALQGLRNKGKIKQHQKILINGAGGGVGTFAVQIAKNLNCEITGVDSKQKLKLLQSLGVDHVIDYKKTDFTTHSNSYDLIIDVFCRHSIFDYKRVLNPKGKCILIGGKGSFVFQALLFGSWFLGKKKVQLLLLKTNTDDLDYLTKLFEKDKIKPVIDSVYNLNDIADAFQYFGTGDFKGKIVIKISK